MNEQPSLRDCVIAEILGTFILIFFGLGAVHAAVLFGAQSGLWQVAIVWGVAIMLAIFCVGGISGAHINPAVTIAMLCWNSFPRDRVLPYIAAQLFGAFIAAAALFAMFNLKLAAVEELKGVVRGQPGSEITACCYGEFYPGPGGLASGNDPLKPEDLTRLKSQVSHTGAFFAETLGTALLLMLIMAMNDLKNSAAPLAKMTPIFVGLIVALLISVIAPLTQACFNPARDFAPRLFSALAGWGSVALPLGHDWGWLTVYIVAPILGGILGGGFYVRILKPIYDRTHRA